MAKSATLPPADVAVVPVAVPRATAIAKQDKNSQIVKDFLASEVATKSNYLACSPDSMLAQVMEENGMSGEKFSFGDLPRAKPIGGGSDKWMIESVAGDETTNVIEGVLVYYGKAGVLWATSQSQSGAKPLLVTSDLIDAVQLHDDFGDLDVEAVESAFTHVDEAGKKHYDWRKLPYNEWGSGKNNSKRCKEQRLLCILRKDDNVPIFIRVPPTGVNSVTSFLKKLTLQTQRPHYQSVVKLTLIKAINSEETAYSKINIEGAGFVSKEEGQFFKAMFTDSLGHAMSEAVETADSEE